MSGPICTLGVVLLDPADPLSEIIPLRDAPARAGVADRTVRRWVADDKLPLIPNLPGKYVTVRAVLECERDRHIASRQGRPGARPTARLDMPA